MIEATPPSDASWVPPLVIDAHAHYVPPAFVDRAQRDPGALGATVDLDDDGRASAISVGKRSFLVPTPGLYLLEDRLATMDAAAVDVHILLPAPFLFYYWADAELALEVARLTNDATAETVSQAPDRLIGLATVPLSSPDAAKEVERALGELGLAGVELGTEYVGEFIDGPSFDPILRAVLDADACVFVHPHNLHPAPGLDDYYLINTIGNPMSTTVAMGRFLFSGKLEQYSGLRTMWAHAGGYAALALGRWNHGQEVRPEAREGTSRVISEFVDQIWVDSISHDVDALQFVAHKFGKANVVLGTDYNFDMGVEDPVGFLREVAGRDTDLADGVAGRNVLAALGSKSQAMLAARRRMTGENDRS